MAGGRMNGARAYLDYNASAPLRPEARAAVLAALDAAGNPSSVHAEGRAARAIVETAREHVAALVGARPAEVVFTSGATESNAWVMAQGWDAIACAAHEHPSVLGPVQAAGAGMIELGAREDGETSLAALAQSGAFIKAARPLVSLHLANGETGVIQPLTDAVALCPSHAIVHTDATQAAGRMPIDVAALGVDLMSISAHKLGGPKGVGALIVREGVSLKPLIGGGQERRRRGGTENIAAIAGFGAAAAAARRDLADMVRLAALRDRLEGEATRLAPGAVVIGARARRLANTACMALPGHRAETLVIRMDLAGVAVSAGSACSSGKAESSHVLAAMGIADPIARSAIRVSLGHATTDADVEAFLAAWAAIVTAPSNGGRLRTRAAIAPERVSASAGEQ